MHYIEKIHNFFYAWKYSFVLLLAQKSSPYTYNYDLADKKCLQYMDNSCPETDDGTTNNQKRVCRRPRTYSSSEGKASSVQTELCTQFNICFPVGTNYGLSFQMSPLHSQGSRPGLWVHVKAPWVSWSSHLT